MDTITDGDTQSGMSHSLVIIAVGSSSGSSSCSRGRRTVGEGHILLDGGLDSGRGTAGSGGRSTTGSTAGKLVVVVVERRGGEEEERVDRTTVRIKGSGKLQ